MFPNIIVFASMTKSSLKCKFEYLHFQSKPFINLKIFATVHCLMKDINLIDSCQAHLPVQYASGIEFICQK